MTRRCTTCHAPTPPRPHKHPEHITVIISRRPEPGGVGAMSAVLWLGVSAA